MESVGTVRLWSAAEGWGVIDSADTPGGCWVHFSALTGGRTALVPNDEVTFEFVTAEQDGFACRATRVGNGRLSESGPSSEAYASSLTVEDDA